MAGQHRSTWWETLLALPEVEQHRVLLDLLRRNLVRAVGDEGERVPFDPRVPFTRLGLGGGSTAGFRDALSTELGLPLPATLLFDHPSPERLASYLRDRVLRTSVSAGVAGGSSPGGEARPDPVHDPIVIVSMACRFPGGVRGPEDLWELLVEGRDAVVDLPTDRGWDLAAGYDPDPSRSGTFYTSQGGFLDDVAGFDAAFFGIAPREALAMDPQQRLLLEVSWEALERAGIDPFSLRGSSTGVFTGIAVADYSPPWRTAPAAVEGHLMSGTLPSVASGRVAYTLGLEGPAVTVDTACSSSLTALHLAAQALRAGECTLAMVGGATVMSTTDVLVEFSRQQGLAPDGRCKSFAQAADGTGWAEGAAVVVLERQSDARRNGHAVLAVVRGSAVNSDGASNGLTAPSGPAQQRVIRAALAGAALTPSDVDAVEAHGTGTRLGDPIEAQAIIATYGQDRAADRPLWLGSLKSNIGHTVAAAGLGGVIKMVLALRHGLLPRTLHVDAPASRVDWSAGQVRLLTEPVPWPRAARVRRAGVSAFGVSGTNAHVIVEEAPHVADVSATDVSVADDSLAGVSVAGVSAAGDGGPGRHLPWLLSARSEPALREQAARLLARVTSEPRPALVDVAWSLVTGRAVLEHRAAVVAADLAGMLRGLGALAAGEPSASLIRGVTRPARHTDRLAFLFTGQGAQRLGMGRELYGRHRVFAESFDAICSAFGQHLTRPLRDVVFGTDPVPTDAPTDAALDRTEYTQPALFALEVALVDLLGSWGVHPDLLLGHSIGELAAAHVAGVFSLDDACALVAARGRLMQAMPAGGAMVSLRASEAQALDLLAAWGGPTGPGAGQVDVAAVNGPESVVLSGDARAVLEIAQRWRADGGKASRLHVSHAFHSAHMDGMLAEFGALVRGLSMRPPEIPLVSNLTGQIADPDELRSADYWVRQVRSAVRFRDGIDRLHERGVRTFLEIGPDAVLTGMGQECLAGETDAVFVPTLRRDADEHTALDRALALLAVSGVDVDWPAISAGTGARRVDLPTYPFQHRRFWLGDILSAPALPGGLAGTGAGTGSGVGAAGTQERAGEAGERTFWDAVARGDLTEVLDVPPDTPLHTVLPALAAWRADRLGQEAVDRWSYRAVWRPVAMPPVEGAPGRWLLVVPADGVGGTPTNGTPTNGAVVDGAVVDGAVVDGAVVDGCVRAIEGGGGQVIAVLPVGTDSHEAERDSVAALLADVDTGGGPLTGVLSLLALDERDRSDHPAVSRGLAATLTLLQALGDAGIDAPLWCATHAAMPAGLVGAHPAGNEPAGNEPAAAEDASGADGPSATGDAVPTGGSASGTEPAAAAAGLSAVQAQVWGLGRVAALELPRSWGGLVDLPAVVDGPAARRLAAVLVGATGEDQVAIRDSGVFARRLIRARPDPAGVGWRPRGTVLITGGTGALGAAVARWCADRGAARLVLTSRRGMEAPGASGLVADLAGRGVEVTVVACDAADRDALAAVLAAIPATSPLTAVVHAAGVAGRFTGLRDIDIAEFADVVTGKVAGARHLDELLGTRELDAFVLFSSIAGTWGSGGQCAYSAANACLDAVAAHRAARGLAASALAWGPWAEGGMAVDPEVAGHLRERGLRPLRPELAVAVLERAGGAAGVRTVADVDWDRFTPIFTAARPSRLLADLPEADAALSPRAASPQGALTPPTAGAADTGGGAEPLRRPAGMSDPDWRRLLLAMVRAETAAVLGYDEADQVPADRALSELGSTSLTAVQLRARLADRTGLALPTTVVFDHPTPAALAGFLAGELTGVRPATEPAAPGGAADHATGGGGDHGGGAAADRPPVGPAVSAVALAGPPTALRTGPADDPIAIVGMGCRFPGGVSSPAQLWDVVVRGGDMVSGFPVDRGWDLGALFSGDPGVPGRSDVRVGGFLADVAGFDADFFGISPREALAMDPQQRLLLEVSWEALEHAGIDPTSLRGTDTGVFIGANIHDYMTLLSREPERTEGYLATGTASSVLSGRVAYTLGLEGPALTVDTACSSSLVALHVAVRSLRVGECSLALVGGVTVMSTPVGFVEFSRQGGLAVDGRVKAFGEGADGTGWGEGVGVVVVERLSVARERGHRVLAVVGGSAVNSDGGSNGLTAPSGVAQERVLRAALVDAGVSADGVDVVEGHGTGTR
ncbi:type I polyketide synthase, partial [Parafrankia sp. EUN1f]|uniref:type I polyketide synthase n=1 Tax=Parafrankia sp. EUN1f TaxID=102897 RepID=UPI0001C467A2